MGKRYIITSDIFGDEKKMYLCWQPSDYDDGCFWTWNDEYILNCLRYNEEPHRFIFSTEEEALNLAKCININNYKVEAIYII